MSRELIKTKFPGIYYEQDAKTKVKTYIARIKIAGVIDTCFSKSCFYVIIWLAFCTSHNAI